MTPTYAEVFALLVRTETSIWNAVDKGLRLEPGTVRLARLEILRAVKAADGSGRVQNIAQQLGTTVGAVSRLVDRLISDGLLLRTPHPTDGRSSLLALSPAGLSAADITETAYDRVLTTLLGGLDSAATEQLVHLLRGLNGSATQMETPR